MGTTRLTLVSVLWEISCFGVSLKKPCSLKCFFAQACGNVIGHNFGELVVSAEEESELGCKEAGLTSENSVLRLPGL